MAAICKECREGDRGTVLAAACNPPHSMSPFSPGACRQPLPGAACAGDTELSEGHSRWVQPVAGTGLGWVAGGWWQGWS